MKKISKKISVKIILSIALGIFMFGQTAKAQVPPGCNPYDICNNNATDVYQVSYWIACSGTAGWFTQVIPPGTCFTIPVSNFAAAGLTGPGCGCILKSW